MENKLRHIDELLKTSLDQYDDTVVFDSDWLAVEKKLKWRKNRIYAMWFSLALIALIGGALVLSEFTDINNNSGNSTEQITSDTGLSTDSKPELLTEDENSTTDQPVLGEGENKPETPVNTSDPDLTNTDSRRISPEQNSSNQSTQETPGEPFEKPDAPGKVDSRIITEIPIIPAIVTTYPEEYLEGIGEAFKNIRTTIFKKSNAEQLRLGFGITHTEIGASFSPVYAGKFVTENANLAGLIHKEYYEKAFKSEYATQALNATFNIEVHFRNGLFIGSGLGIVQRAEYIDYNYVVDSAPVVNDEANRIEYYVGDPLFEPVNINYSGSNSYNFIELPITLGYSAYLNDRFSLRSQVDLSYLMLLNSSGKKADYTYLLLSDLKDLSYFNKNNFGITIKSGFYANFKNFVIGVEPVFSTNLNSLSNENSALQIKPYSYGLNLTTNFKINRF